MSIATTNAALSLAQGLVDKNGNVPLYHKAGLLTGWIDNGRGGSQLDPESKCHDFVIPLAQLKARTGNNAGGTITHLTYPASSWHTIVRAENGRLVIGDPKLPTWMY